MAVAFWRRAFGAAGGALLAGMIGGVWLWAMTAAWPDTPDGLLHLQRVRALAEAWRQGVWYPRWFPDFAFGYGHPILHYYAPGAYVAPALVHVVGLELLAAVRLWLALVFGLSATILMVALPPSFHPAARLSAGLFYLAYPYQLYDLFVRGALPEFAAFLWLPAILAGMVAVLGRSRWAVAGAGTALAWAGLALTHNLTAVMAAMLTVTGIPLAALWRPMGQSYGRRLVAAALRLGLPGVGGALLSAFYLAPMWLEKGWVSVGATGPVRGYTRHFAAWDSLVGVGLRYVYPPADYPTVPLPVYVLLLAVAGGLLLVLTRRQRVATAAALGAMLVAATLMMNISAPFWDVALDIMDKLQFPWRWQTMIAVPSAVLAALCVQWVAAPDGLSRRGWAWGIAVGGGVLACLYAWPGDFAAMTPAISRQAMWSWDAQFGQIGATWAGEFTPVWVAAPRWVIGREPETPPATMPAAALTALPTAIGYLDAAYRIGAGHMQTVTLDRFYFPAWRVTVDGVAAATRPQGELGLLAFDLPPGVHDVRVSWAATAGVWWGRILTGLGWVAVAWVWRRRPWRLVGWAGIAALALVGISGLPVRMAIPQALGADYGSVRLEAALATPTEVDLFWSVQETPLLLVAFVHVLEPDGGAVVAQWDEPVGGPYRPPGRLLPGLLLRQRVAVPIPPDLPAGEYPVLVGLYAPDRPDAPLIPDGWDTPRLPAGYVTVRP